jgi:hypothetical protein
VFKQDGNAPLCVARFLQGPGGNASEHVHRVNASSAMEERCLMAPLVATEGAVASAAEAGSKVAGVEPVTNEEAQDQNRAQAAKK